MGILIWRRISEFFYQIAKINSAKHVIAQRMIVHVIAHNSAQRGHMQHTHIHPTKIPQ